MASPNILGLDDEERAPRSGLLGLRLISDTGAPDADPSLDRWFDDNAPMLTAKQLADLIEQEQTHRRITPSPRRGRPSSAC